MTTSTTTSRTLRDRLALVWYLTRFEWAMQDHPGREFRRIRRDLRASAAAAAREVGMAQALADLGHPYALADEYRATLGRRFPRWGTGAAVAAFAVGMLLYLFAAYSVGVIDGMTALGGGRAELTVLGGTWTYVATDAELSAGGPLLTGPGLLLAVVLGGLTFALSSRVWRLWTRPSS